MVHTPLFLQRTHRGHYYCMIRRKEQDGLARHVSAPPHHKEAQLDKEDNNDDNEQESMPIRRYRRSKKEPLIAVIGRPNVGKSALVNRIAGTQSGGAIVADEAGITRDRTYRDADFLGEAFQIIDTGGLVFDEDPNTLFAAEI